MATQRRSTLGILDDTLRKHPLVSLLGSALAIILTTVGVTWAVVSIFVIPTIQREVNAATQTPRTGTPVFVREDADGEKSIVVLEGLFHEGETILSIDAGFLVEVKAVERDSVVLGGYLTETCNPIKGEMPVGHGFRVFSTGILPTLPDYTFTLVHVDGNAAYLVCRRSLVRQPDGEPAPVAPLDFPEHDSEADGE